MPRFTFAQVAVGAMAVVVTACSESTLTSRQPDVGLAVESPTQEYIVLGTGNTVPATLAADVAALGGSIRSTTPEIGMAVVQLSRSDALGALARLKGVTDVASDVVVQWQDPSQKVELTELTGTEAAAGSVVGQAFGGAETFRAAQWAPDAISAPAAWDAGYKGRGARVAIIDGGLHNTHLDIAPNLDVARSTSFVPGQPYNADVGTFWHGTHVAGIVAAPGQGAGTVGIAPEATIIGVKALHNGSGAASWVINGIVYAATPIARGGAGADIINLSLGSVFVRSGRGAAQLANSFSRALTYARQQGALPIVAAGNNAIDLDHTANVVSFPAQGAGAVTVSALGPLGWGLDKSVSLDRPASYTNYGQSAITLAGPGGDGVLPGNAVCQVPRFPSGVINQFCFALDLVIAPCRGPGASTSSYCWAAGTSMATPAVAGVAALIVGKYGRMQPAQLESILRASADDLGKPGNDDFYGRGRVNAFRAVQ